MNHGVHVTHWTMRESKSWPPRGAAGVDGERRGGLLQCKGKGWQRSHHTARTFPAQCFLRHR